MHLFYIRGATWDVVRDFASQFSEPGSSANRSTSVNRSSGREFHVLSVTRLEMVRESVGLVGWYSRGWGRITVVVFLAKAMESVSGGVHVLRGRLKLKARSAVCSCWLHAPLWPLRPVCAWWRRTIRGYEGNVYVGWDGLQNRRL